MGWIGWTVVGVILVGGGYVAVREFRKASRRTSTATTGSFLRPGTGWARFGSEQYQRDIDANAARAEKGQAPLPISSPGGIYATGKTVVTS